MLGRKVIYVRCISCSYNNVAKSIRLLDKQLFLFIQEKIYASKSFERYIPINSTNSSLSDARIKRECARKIE